MNFCFWYMLWFSKTFLFPPTSSLSWSVRNALVVMAASLVAFSWEAYGYHVFTVTGKTSQGLPPFSPPPTSDATANGTVVSFGEIVEVRSRETRPATGWGQSLFVIQVIHLQLSLPKIFPVCKKCSWLDTSLLCGFVQGFGGGLAVIPLMGLLESLAIAKAFGKYF